MVECDARQGLEDCQAQLRERSLPGYRKHDIMSHRRETDSGSPPIKMNDEFVSSPPTRRVRDPYPAKYWPGFRVARWILLLCILHALRAAAAQPGPATRRAAKSHDFSDPGRHARMAEPSFAHLTTNDGLSQNSVTEILQDRRGLMWFATRDGLNRYDGSALVVYKHHPNDPPANCATLFCRAFRG